MWDAYATDLRTVASYGFVVVGASSCPETQCGARYSADQLQTIAACKQHGAKLHPALAKADFSRTAVYGTLKRERERESARARKRKREREATKKKHTYIVHIS